MKKLKTTWTETLLAFAMVCSVWTEYRFLGVIGLSEIILLFIGFFGKYSDSEDLGDYHKAQDDYVKVIAIITPLGLAWHFFVSGTYRDMLHDLLAFVFIAFMVFRVFNRAKLYEHLLGILCKFLWFGAVMNIIYLGMYYSGQGFYMEERFSGFSQDPNQLGEVLFMVPWFGLYFLKKMIEEKPGLAFIHSVGCIFCIATSVYLGFLTESDTFIVSLYISVAAFFVFELINLFTGRSKSLFPLLLILAAIIVLLLYYKTIIAGINDYVDSASKNANQLNVRQAVWLHGLEAFLRSPIVGNGPGVHSGRWAAFGGAESHNTYIYILMDYGFVGFIMLMTMIWASFKKLWSAKSSAMLAGFVSFLVFNFFHSFQRMPLFWFYIYIFISVGIYELKRSEKAEESYLVSQDENVVHT